MLNNCVKGVGAVIQDGCIHQSWVKSDMDTLLSKDLSTFPLQPAIDWLHGSLSTFLKFNSKRPGCDLHCGPSRSVVLHLVG